MPIHDWTRVYAGLFHHFHQSYSIRIAEALNNGLLPRGMTALVEQRSGPIRAIASNLTVNYSLWMLTWTRGKRKMVRNVARAPEVRDVADRSQGTFYTAL